MVHENQATTLLMVNEVQLKNIVMDTLKEVMRQTKAETMAAKEEATLSRLEVEQTLRVSKQTLWRWEKMGYLKPKRAGKRLLYFKSDIEALLQKGA